ncbi:MAG: FHA domain-containing protein, partial [bacterium]|nr:FHA domain-containing protein [bacterium]
MSLLIAQKGPHAGRRFSLRERTRIGRALDNDIVLADHLVSRYHAEITRDGIHYQVRDLGSKNGLLVNGEAKGEHRLTRGDELQIGATVFLYDVPLAHKTARYSNTVVQLNLRSDPSTLVIDRSALPAPPPTQATQMIVGLGRPLQAVTQLTHIARPGITLQQRPGL